MRLTYKSKNKRELIELCIEHKLFVKGWVLKKDFDSLLTKDLRKFGGVIIIVAFAKGIPVGVIMQYGIVMFYVKPEYRRKGIATKLYKRLGTVLELSRTFSGEGVKGSLGFFRSISQVYYNREKRKNV